MYASRRRRRRRQRILLLAGLLLLALLALLAALALTGAVDSDEAKTQRRSAPDGPREEPAAAQERTSGTQADDTRATPEEGPDSVKAIYLTAYAAGRNLDLYLDLLDRTELNAVVVDVKDVTGEVMYPSNVDLANDIGARRNVLPDLEALVKELHRHGVYAIARVATFEDDILPRQRPDLAVTDSATGTPWLNYAGQTWSNPYEREVWEYNVAIAREAAEAGFDEIQFDYIRFPSDGPMERIRYGEETYPTREDALAAFLEYARRELEPTGARIAADVFGLAATDDGAGVGQVIPKLVPHLDVICPMVYPSHFPAGSYGLSSPNAEPYTVIEKAMTDFEQDVERANPDVEIRPWLQDFDLGAPPYGPREIRAQIRATYDSGATGWLLWNPANEYTEAALKPEGRDDGSGR
ncbi:MAG: putative glycoside hydrolase [Actinomycetota bacterium]